MISFRLVVSGQPFAGQPICCAARQADDVTRCFEISAEGANGRSTSFAILLPEIVLKKQLEHLVARNGFAFDFDESFQKNQTEWSVEVQVLFHESLIGIKLFSKLQMQSWQN